MIEKIISIRNLGRFRDYQATGDVAMRRLTLIYGENGRGKTTLCALLRSLGTGDATPLQARKTLGQRNEPSVELRLGGQTVTLRNRAWSATVPDIAVFDSSFIHDNVYAGDYVDHEHKQNSYRVIVGARGVQLTRQIVGLDSDIRNANTDIRRLREGLEAVAGRTMTVDAFLALAEVPNIDAEIRAKETELQQLTQAIQQAEQIRIKSELRVVQMTEVPDRIEDLLGRSIPEIARDAEARVREHIAAHLDDRGEMWLAQGTSYLDGAECPFCGLNLDDSDLVAMYRSYFNADYERLKDDIAALSRRVEEALGGDVVANLAGQIAANTELVGFWGQFFDATLPTIQIDAIRTALGRARALAADAVAAKGRAPLDVIRLPAEWAEIDTSMQAILRDLGEYNQRIAQVNAEITRRKQARPEQDVGRVNGELQRLQLAKKRFEVAVVTHCDSLIAATTRKAQFEQQKETIRQQLDQYCAQVLREHQDQINRYLEQFNTSFRITNTRHQYLGGTPSSQFQVVINAVPVDLGDERTPDDTPSFKTVLSAGDRSALALAFFLACLQREGNLNQRIVVLDDPFCSQDGFRRSSTQYMVARCAREADQVLVLSHDPQFLKSVADEANGVPVSRLQTVAVGDAVGIAACDLDAILGCPLSKDRRALSLYISRGEGAPLDVARAIRPVLEGHIRQGSPGSFNDRQMLGEMVDAIRNAQDDQPLASFKPVVDEIDQINRYARQFHHAPNQQQVAPPPIDGAELSGYAQRALRLVGGC